MKTIEERTRLRFSVALVVFFAAISPCHSADQEQRTNQARPASQAAKPPGPSLAGWVDQVRRPIEFYGKVVDQDNRPVGGANIQLSCNQIHANRSMETNLTTTPAGLFQLKGMEGSSLGVRVSKAGYYTVGRSNQTKFSYTALPGDTPFSPDPNRPVVFRLRKKGPGTELITSAYGVSPDLRVQARLDGTPIRVDLLERKFGRTGHLIISQQKPEASKWKEANEWSFTMEIPDGGFVEQNEEFPFEAPEDGYRRSVSFRLVRGEPNWSSFVKKSYYIAFGNPRRYGRLELQTQIGMNGARLQYVINPDGSRYLEGKEYKEPERVLPPGVTEVR